MNAPNPKKMEAETATVLIATNQDTCHGNVQNQKKKGAKALVVVDLQTEAEIAAATTATNLDTFHGIVQNQENHGTTIKVEAEEVMAEIAAVIIATNPDTYPGIVENPENHGTALPTELAEETGETGIVLNAVNQVTFPEIVKGKVAATEIASGGTRTSHLGMMVASLMEGAIKIMTTEILGRRVLSAGRKDTRVITVLDFDKEFVYLF